MSIVYRLIGVALALTALALGGWYIGHLRAELSVAQEATRTAQAALKKTQSTLALREKQRATGARKAASAQASLDAVLRASSWGTSPVPQEVQIDLCKTLECLHAVPDGLRGASANDSP